MRNANIAVRTPQVNRPAQRSGRRQEKNVKINFRERGYEGVDKIQLIQDKRPKADFCELPNENPTLTTNGISSLCEQLQRFQVSPCIM
jgi:hypothetical protein